MEPHCLRLGQARCGIHNPLTIGQCNAGILPAGDYQFIKCRLAPASAAPAGVDLAAISVYAAARNLVFGLILLKRCRLWAATQVISQKLAALPPPRSARWRSTRSLKGTMMPVGTVKFFNTQKGFGFIQPEDGSKDVFVHITAVERAGMRSLNEGQRISYEIVTERGKQAAGNLQPA
jgi:CspA family cold shock protein